MTTRPNTSAATDGTLADLTMRRAQIVDQITVLRDLLQSDGLSASAPGEPRRVRPEWFTLLRLLDDLYRIDAEADARIFGPL